MKRWIKWTVGGLGAVVVLAAAVAATGTYLGDRKMQRQISVAVKAVDLPTDAAGLERGRYLFMSRACMVCHGVNGGGKTFVNDGKLHMAGPNITQGGVTANYKVEDWVRTIRHGVKPDGRPVYIMPSEDYNRFTNEDVGALIAYVRSLPPQTGGAAILQLPLPMRALYGFGVIPDAAERIDHSLPPASPVAAAVTPQHGAYVVNMCIGCHGEHLSGGKIAAGPPHWPPAANLTPGTGSALQRYASADQFIAMMRSGKRPDGSAIAVMPFESLGQMNDVDLQALYAYLKTVPAREAGKH